MELIPLMKKMLADLEKEIKCGEAELAAMPLGHITQEVHQGKPTLVIKGIR